jgi:hypothetical protein
LLEISVKDTGPELARTPSSVRALTAYLLLVVSFTHEL